MTENTTATARQAEIAHLAERLWTAGVTHLSFALPLRGYLGIYGVRTAGTGWVPVTANRHAPVDGSRLRLAEVLTELIAEDPGCEALAVEEDGRARLALYPVPGVREDASRPAYGAGAVLVDPEVASAERGRKIVAEFLACQVLGAEQGPAEQTAQGQALMEMHRQLSRSAEGEEPMAVIADAIADVLHHADGWLRFSVVFDRAYGLHWGTVTMAEVTAAEYGADLRGLDAVAGTVAALFAAAAALEISAEDVTDRAEEHFLDDIEEARWAAVRAARS
ncbi:hypothetical protein [Streptomyces sp. NPDC002324]